MRHLSIDIETYSPEPLGRAGLYRYAQHPDFQILLFACSLDGQPVQTVDLTKPGDFIPPRLAFILFDPTCIKHAFNAAF